MDAVYRRLEGVRLTQALDLTAVGASPDADVFWFVDGAAFGKCRTADRLPWSLVRGAHTVACVDAEGRADRIRITVE